MLRTVSERKRVQKEPTELSLNSRFITSLSSETSCSVRPTLSLCQRNNKSRRIFLHRNYSVTLLTCYLIYTKENHRKIFFEYKDDWDKTWNWTKLRWLNIRQTSHSLNMFLLYVRWKHQMKQWKGLTSDQVDQSWGAQSGYISLCCTRIPTHVTNKESWMNKWGCSRNIS